MKSTRLVNYALAVLCLAFGKWASAQDCGVPSAVDFLDINNVRATITNGQRVWQGTDFNAGYEVPAGGGVHAMYAGSMWMGGLSPDQQLKIAGGEYGFDETDYFAGPLGDDALTSAEQCQQWDRIWKMYRIQSLKHVEYFDCLNDPDCDVSDFGEYETPEVFLDYPAHGDVSLGQAFYLAPFYDYDQDGNYDPSNGDCPLFEGMVDNSEGCEVCDMLKGDCCLFWIDNDNGGLHTATQGESIGIEIHSMAYAYASSDVLNNTTFYSRKIINRGTQTMAETYIGYWADVDLGHSTDDFIQCDINRDLGFVLNGDSYDEQYGENPPLCGIRLMNGPLMDLDEVDNDEDGIIDNERFGMTNFMYYNNNGGLGSPTQALHYYNLMKSISPNGLPASCNFGETSTPWLFAGDTYDEEDPCFGSTESNSGNPPNDRRFIMSSGPFVMQPGWSDCITHAVVWSDNPNATNNSDQQEYFISSVDTVINHELSCFSCIPPSAAFIQTPNGDGYDFMPASSNGVSYEWTFGDGSGSSVSCPTHVYDVSGNYEVCLTVTNECGEVSSCTQMDVIAGVEEDALVQYDLLYSAQGNTVTFVGGATQAINVQLFDGMGKLVMSKNGNTNTSMTLPVLSAGVYVTVVENTSGEHLLNEKLVLAQ